MTIAGVCRKSHRTFVAISEEMDIQQDALLTSDRFLQKAAYKNRQNGE